jgi:thioredoxin reductase
VSWDCVIVGGGPAGLSAALMLGRCRRRVLLCDVGEQRNHRSHALHAYLTRDGVAPDEFLRLARAELGRYATVECRELEIREASRENGGFALRGSDGTRLHTRKLLLATGVIDELPALDGLDALYGTSVHHCPYCDAWEWQDRPLAAYGEGEAASGLALSLTFWSPDVLLCTGGTELPAGAVGSGSSGWKGTTEGSNGSCSQAGSRPCEARSSSSPDSASEAPWPSGWGAASPRRVPWIRAPAR